VGGVKKKKKYPGIIERITAKKLAKSVILVDRHNAPRLSKLSDVLMQNGKKYSVDILTYLKPY
jgi:hypothetical protein